MIPSDPTAPADGIDAVTALLDASRRYATHVRLLVDQLADAHLVGEDAARVQDAIYAVTETASQALAVAVGLHRHPRPARCPAYNLLTDAEWEPLADGAFARRLAYGCELQPGHPGLHAAQAQGEAPSRDTWLRWGDGTRELVELPTCRARRRGPDPKGVDDEGCSLFADHAGAHAVGQWLGDLELEPEHRHTGR
ncbi:hypothetical protein MTP10_40865 [Nonomuraea sp. 3-1Str]|uniref:hypothetical protein n=1 Tax=Nonomuraea sp. 3-1Str TaxID=2929801 RepID=UPI00285B0BEA|nr:hypothetical protein [Nonomuraea sp. 3-1Str]MDR8415070.1 hypothetical protein [Nonomuraea sp. 3-1Str]